MNGTSQVFGCQGHLEVAQNRSAGKPAYDVTAPALGGLRAEPVAEVFMVLQRLAASRPIKLCPIYCHYANTPSLRPQNGFVVLSPLCCQEADIVVLNQLSDMDIVEDPKLARSLINDA